MLSGSHREPTDNLLQLASKAIPKVVQGQETCGTAVKKHTLNEKKE